jgi:hypothetical protein
MIHLLRNLWRHYMYADEHTCHSVFCCKMRYPSGRICTRYQPLSDVSVSRLGGRRGLGGIFTSVIFTSYASQAVTHSPRGQIRKLWLTHGGLWPLIQLQIQPSLLPIWPLIKGFLTEWHQAAWAAGVRGSPRVGAILRSHRWEMFATTIGISDYATFHHTIMIVTSILESQSVSWCLHLLRK